jgi:hypothetical protein
MSNTERSWKSWNVRLNDFHLFINKINFSDCGLLVDERKFEMWFVVWAEPRCRWGVNIPTSYRWGSMGAAILTDGFLNFSQSLQENAGLLLWIKPRPVPPTSAPLHLMIWCNIIELLLASWNKQLQFSGDSNLFTRKRCPYSERHALPSQRALMFVRGK